MEDRISKAIEDIDSIRNMMEESRGDHLGLAKLSVVYGIYCLLENVIALCTIYMSKYHYIVFTLKIGMLILLIGSFIYIYNAERKCTNKYYLSLYGIWVILGMILPVMFTCSNVLCSISAARFNVKTTFDAIELPANVLLFSAFLLVCAYVTEKKKLIYISSVILFAYIMLSTVWWDRGINVPMPMSEDAVLTSSYIYHMLFVCCGYIFMGLYLWRRGRHEN